MNKNNYEKNTATPALLEETVIIKRFLIHYMFLRISQTNCIRSQPYKRDVVLLV